MRKTIITSIMILLPLCANAQEVKDSAVVAFNDSVFQTLPEVMVTGNKPIVKVDGAKLVFDVEQLTKEKPVDNAYDALKYLPGVTQQGDDINLGGMPVSLMMNGKLTSMTREQLVTLLKSMPASRVQSAEVMYSAPARYQVRGALINVVLNKESKKDTSLQGELYAKAEAEHEAHFNERASLAFHKGIVAVDGYYSLTHGKSFFTTDKTGIHTLADGQKYDIATQMVIGGDGRPLHDYRIAADLDFAKDHQLSISYSGNYKDKNQHTEMTGFQTSSMDNHIKDILHNAHLDYTIPIGLNVGADFTYYEYNISQDLSSSLLGDKLDFITTSQQRINRSKLFAREEHTWGKNASVNYGMVYTHIIDHSRQDYQPTGETTAGQLPSPLYSRRTEDMLNIYGGGSFKLNDKFSFELSLAAEYSKTMLWNKWDIYPTLTATYMPQSGRRWKLSFSTDKQYPAFWAMQNVTSYYGGNYEQIVGNPALKPSKDFDISLVHVLHNKYIFRGWFTHSKDYFIQTMFQSRDQLVEIDKFDNFDFRQEAGIMVSSPWKPAWWFDARATLFGEWMRVKDSDYFDCPFDRNIAYAMVSANATFRFVQSHDLSFTLNGFARTLAYQGPLDLPASGNLNLNLRYAFCKGNAILNLYCNDLFRTMMITPENHWGGQYLRSKYSCYRTVGLSFTYRFGGYKAKNREAVDTARMKK